MRRDLKTEFTLRLQNSDDQTTLDLSQLEINSLDIPLVIDFLKENPKITSLDLSNNRINSDGLKYFAKHNKTVKNLIIRGNNINTEGAMNFIVYNKITTHIDAINNPIGLSENNAQGLKIYLASGKYLPPASFLVTDRDDSLVQQTVNGILQDYHSLYNSFYRYVAVYFELLKIMQHYESQGSNLLLKEIRKKIGFFLIFANTDDITINRQNLIEQGYSLPIAQRTAFFQPCIPLPDALKNLWDTINRLLSEAEDEYYVTHLQLSDGDDILVSLNSLDAATYFHQICLNHLAIFCTTNVNLCIVSLPALTVCEDMFSKPISTPEMTALHYDKNFTTYEISKFAEDFCEEDNDFPESLCSDFSFSYS